MAHLENTLRVNIIYKVGLILSTRDYYNITPFGFALFMSSLVYASIPLNPPLKSFFE